MIIIGEKVNGFIPRTLQAIEERDEAYIRKIAEAQTEFGADFIDVCAGTAPEIERETMKWLIGLVQDTVDTPLCIDSSDTDVLLEMMQLANKPGMINSISGETGKCEAILPVIGGTDWKVVALTCDQSGIPTDPEVKFQIADSLIQKALAHDVPLGNIFIDPLVTTLATTNDSLLSFNEAVRKIKGKYPEVHITSGLSNISFGMPFRKAINTQFLALAMSAGMDSAIMDPTSADMRATLYSTDALLGNDDFCMNYLTAFRKGVIGPAKK
ncbi:MAG: methyltetrahydrofolate cobalamin methyltransferase [Clostridiales bacterium]|nr:methyltetrahydrofolate cobalamin methyltransferase [Clostridiales bacterium]